MADTETTQTSFLAVPLPDLPRRFMEGVGPMEVREEEVYTWIERFMRAFRDFLEHLNRYTSSITPGDVTIPTDSDILLEQSYVTPGTIYTADLVSTNRQTGYNGLGLYEDSDYSELSLLYSQGLIRTAVYQQEQILGAIAGNIMLSPADTLVTAMTAADNETVTVDGDGATFEVGDILRIKGADYVTTYSWTDNNFSDDFTGTNSDNPDTSLWTESGSGDAYIYNNSLRLEAPAYVNGLVGNALSGDFDIEIEYLIQSDPDYSYDVAIKCLNAASQTYANHVSLWRQGAGASRYYIITQYREGGSWQTVDTELPATTFDVYDDGIKLRIKRIGDQIYTGWYNPGDSGTVLGEDWTQFIVHNNVGAGDDPIIPGIYCTTWDNNPAAVVDILYYKQRFLDGFSESDGDPPLDSFWTVGPNVTCQSGKLDIDQTCGSMRSKFYFEGDFDAHIDVDVNTAPTTETWYSGYGIYIDINNYMYVERIWDSVFGHGYRARYNALGAGEAITETFTITNPSKLRVDRVGSTVSVYHWVSNQWVQIESQTLTDSRGYIEFVHDTSASDSFQVDYDNFLVYDGDFVLEVGANNEDEWLQVTQVTGDTYTVTRDVALAYDADSNPTWNPGVTVVNYGMADEVLVEIQGGDNALIRAITHNDDPWDNIYEWARLGNLAGYLDLPELTAGFAAGDDTQYIKAYSTEGGAAVVEIVGDITPVGSLSAPSGITCTGNLVVNSGNIDLNGNIDVSGTSDLHGTVTTYGTVSAGAGINVTGIIFVNETETTDHTKGLCLNMLTETDEAITLKSTGIVAHGMTSRVETDTFLRVRKASTTTGGAYFEALGSSNSGFHLQGSITTGETSLGDTTYAPFRLTGSLKSGTSSAAFPSGYNIGCFVNHSTVVWKCQSHGLVWQSGPLLINDTACADITTGICVNQGAADDYNIVGKSSDVDHNLAQYLEEDGYYGLKKCHGDYGGVQITSVMEDQNYAPAMTIISAGGQAPTTKSTSGRALMEFFVTEHDNANTRTNITADGNCYGWRARKGGSFETIMLLDEDGDTWQTGGAEFGGHLKSNLSVSTNGIELIQTGSNRIDIEGDANRTNTDDVILRIKGEWNGTEVANINFRAGTDTANKDDGYMDFFTATGGALSNQMKITETGGIFMYNLKSGATAAGAGAGTNELWVTASHASLPDGVVMMG